MSGSVLKPVITNAVKVSELIVAGCVVMAIVKRIRQLPAETLVKICVDENSKSTCRAQQYR